MKKWHMMSLIALANVMIFLTACGQTAINKSTSNFSKNSIETVKASQPYEVPKLAEKRGNVLVVGIEKPDDGKMIPLNSSSIYNQYMWEMVYDCLGDVDEKGEPIPGIAKWDISKDGLVYTFHIKDNVKFSDGTPLTAEDVEFTFTYLCDKLTNSNTFDPSTVNIKGWKDYSDGKTNKVEGIKVKDSHTISFELEKENTSAIYALARTLIVSKKLLGKNYKQGNASSIETMENTPIGSGQYIFKESKPGEEYDFEANPNYWRGKPKIEKVILKVTNQNNAMQMLKDGEIDLNQIKPNNEAIEEIKSFKYVDFTTFPANVYGYIGINLNRDIFKDKKVRQALTYGLDRENIVKNVFGSYGTVCNEPQSVASWNYNEDVNKYKFNTDKANKLLDEAGWKKDSDGIRKKNGQKFQIHYLASSDNPVNDVLIPIMKENYKKLGIEVLVDSMDFTSVNNKVENKDFDMFFMAGSLSANPDQSVVFKTEGTQNFFGYSNKELDKEMSDSLKEQNFDTRKKDYKKVWEMINDDMPTIFMYQRNDMWAISSRVKGINVTPYKDFTVSLWKAKLK
ncbi:ABC transporter substrate-binding protein [Clostridium felsineum]|nr:ABC transporter substrate-binding protein [Clostridium felsineum]URZ07256.1 Oligopeptide-binding protein AppA [Clostridium felsineum]